MIPDDRLTALNRTRGELSDTRTAVESLHRDVQESRRKIRWLIAACAAVAIAAFGAVSWTAYQQTVINSKSAAIALLEDQNADRAVVQARNAHNLCVKLNRTRSEILPVWEKVLSGRPDGQGLLARIEAAIPLGSCPKAWPAGP